MSNLAGVIKESTVDGEGIRTAIFLSGCEHNCKNCHNKEAQDFEFGERLDTNKIFMILKEVVENELVDGITLTGGDPLHPKNVSTSLKIIKMYYEAIRSYEVPYNIWVYTGYTLDELLKRIKEGETEIQKILAHINMLVDGRFIEELKNPNINFAGSSNQNFIDEKQLQNLF